MPHVCRLAILAHDKDADESKHPHISHYKDTSTHSSMVDSGTRRPGYANSQDDGQLSRNNSLAFTGSVGIPSRVSDLSMDSRRSLQPSSSFGSTADNSSAMRSNRSTQTLAGTFTYHLLA